MTDESKDRLICALPSAALHIGVARRDITPPVGIYARAWGAARHDAAEGIHRPLTATAMAMRRDDRGQPVMLIALDSGWWRLVEDEWLIRGAVINKFNLHQANVMICCAHTHAGPSTSTGDAEKPGGHLIRPYLEAVRDAVLEAADEALASAEPATLTWANGRCNLAANRDLPDPAQNRIICGFNPSAPADDMLLVGRVADATGKPRATIVNYACHPTTLAWANQLISPDYVGAMRELVEAQTDGALCMFVQGASGELAPRQQYTHDLAIAERNGRWLGHSVLATLESMLPPQTALHYAGVVESGAPLATWNLKEHEPSNVLSATRIDVELPLKPMPSEAEIQEKLDACSDRALAERLWRKLHVRRKVGPGPTCSMPAWIWRAGDAFLVGQPNEAYSLLQTALRRRFSGRAVAVMNLTNGACGYLAPAELHDLEIYQVWQSPFGPGALEKLIETCGAQIDQMIADERRGSDGGG